MIAHKRPLLDKGRVNKTAYRVLSHIIHHHQHSSVIACKMAGRKVSQTKYKMWRNNQIKFMKDTTEVYFTSFGVMYSNNFRNACVIFTPNEIIYFNRHFYFIRRGQH